MTKNRSLALFAILVLVLLGAVWLHTGSPMPPSGEDAIWFHTGLFTLLIGAFIIEYRFTRPNDVFVNCLIVFASTSTLSHPPYAVWWESLRWGALVCGIAAMILAWDPGQQAKLGASRTRALLYQLVTRLGRAEVIFSLVFVLALLSYFDLKSRDAKVFVVIWGIFLIAAHMDLPALGRTARFTGRHSGRKIIGITHSFLAPSIVFCRKLGDAGVVPHELVGFCQSPSDECHSFGLVIGERSSASETRVVIALLNTSVGDSRLNDRSIVVTPSNADLVACDAAVGQADLSNLKKIVGTVAKGTHISQVKFELFGTPTIAAGSLLSVKSADRAVFYQVFDGIIDEEETLKDSTRAFVEGKAEQVGCWDSARGGFETHDWVARERSPVLLFDVSDPAPEYVLKPTEMSVGTIPNSSYSANVDLRDLVLFHTGILGVTGSGKSFLTFSVIEQAATKGIKSVCIDPTGDYQRYLTDAVLLSRPGSLKAFLDSPDHMIGIIETATNAQTHAIVQTLAAARIALDWCKANRQDDEILTPRPKVMLVLEEAHLLVPEWNFNPQPNLRDRVSETSQIVLQARKYGLGFLIVSQRTANVVKSILNQCNTIVSFQAFDETGFEFLRNYMGSFHVASLPNLKTRHGLVVGKASRSRRPVMVHFHEQVRALRQVAASEMPIPAAQAGMVAEIADGPEN